MTKFFLKNTTLLDTFTFEEYYFISDNYPPRPPYTLIPHSFQEI